MGTDLRTLAGIIGEYEGKDVYVIDKVDFEIKRPMDSDRIYMVVDKRSKKAESLLVHEMEVIGHITPTGGVTEYNNPFEYLIGKPEKKKEEKKREAPVEEPRGEIDIDKFLIWASDTYDPIGEACAMFNLEIEMVVE